MSTERPIGRPPAKIDWDEIGKLLIAGCKAVDVAAQYGLKARTLYDRCEKDLGMSFSEFTQEKRSKGDNLLRAKQYTEAMSGDRGMLIWLGKNRLGQSDKSEVVNQHNLSNFDQWEKMQSGNKESDE